MTPPDLADVTAVVPVRNGARLVPGCLSSLQRNGVERIVVVDGLSTDDSWALAKEYGAHVLSDEGRGLPHARMLGAREATTRLVLLVDVDVVLPDGTVESLLREFHAGHYTALSAGQVSEGGPGYWGRALAQHHRTGRSRHWFTLVATLLERDCLLELGFDERFRSGEDIDLRWRLRQSGARIGVSREATVRHRYAGDDFAFAQDQFVMDGFGLGRMVRGHGWRAVHLLGLPLASGVRGLALSLGRGQPRWVPYYLAFIWWNYRGIAGGLRRGRPA